MRVVLKGVRASRVCRVYFSRHLNDLIGVDDVSSTMCLLSSSKKIAQFRTHDLTKEFAYVSTQSSGQLNTFLLNHFSVYWKVA